MYELVTYNRTNIKRIRTWIDYNNLVWKGMVRTNNVSVQNVIEIRKATAL